MIILTYNVLSIEDGGFCSYVLTTPFSSDQEAERFLEENDLAEYDMSGFKPVRFEFSVKDARVNFRVPAALLDAVKARAAARGILIRPVEHFWQLL